MKNSRDLIEKNPVLADKFYFVEHFVASGRYDIWGELYNELDLCRYVKNRALGGMVGLRTNRPNAPSPFIGMAFKCFVDFLNAYDYHKDIEFRLHFLGIYLLQDRFEIALLEQLFQKLQPDIKIKLTYDSSVASVQAMKRHLYLPAFVKTKNGSYRYLNSFDEINVFLEINSPSDDIMYNLRYIYDESNVKTARLVMEKSFPKRELRLKNEIYKMINKESGKKVKKDTGLLSIFEPFNISSNRHIDDILRAAIESHGAVNILLDSKDIDEVRTSSNQFLMHISHCSEHDRYGEQGVEAQAEMDLFGNPHQLWAIRNNIVETYPFYRWFLDKRDDKRSLGEMIKSYVENHYRKKT